MEKNTFQKGASLYLTNPPVPVRSKSLDIPQLYIAINLAKILKEETPEYLKCIKTLLFRVFFSSYSISFGATFPIPPPTGHCKSAWMPSKLPQKFDSKSPQNLSCAVSKTQLWLLTPRYMGFRHFHRLRFHAQKFKERIWMYKRWNTLMPPVLIQFYWKSWLPNIWKGEVCCNQLDFRILGLWSTKVFIA